MRLFVVGTRSFPTPSASGRRALLLGLACLATALPSAAAAPYDASDPAAPAVTAANLLESERFWPYQLLLTRDFQPPGREGAIASGTRAVLVRVVDERTLRVDFGRDGVYELPAAATDVVARANDVRLGRLSKLGPNFVVAIGARLTDTAYDGIRPVPLDSVYEPRGFLAVFAAPDELEALAEALRPLAGRNGTWTILFPQAQGRDPDIRRQLRALDWKVPFLFDGYAEGYTRSRLGEDAELPAVMLQTPEGRVVYQGAFGAETAEEVAAALERAFPAQRAGR